MKINGSPIGEYHFRSSDTTLTYTMAYELEQARIYAGMSIADFDALPGTSEWVEQGGRCKSDLVILYRMSKYIPAVLQDAAAREMERQANRRRRG